MKRTITGKFEGYLWKSNAQAPILFKNNTLFEPITLDDEDNPFIVEGELFDESNGHSVSIKYVDGKYIINDYFLKQIDENYTFINTKEQSLISGEIVSHVFEGNKMNEKLHFIELWEPVKDDYCNKLEVFRPTLFAFVGFKKDN